MTISRTSARERRYLEIVEANRRLLAGVCYMYATDGDHFNDLYQEVLANIWQGLDTFRGEASITTWLYRTAINSCISYHRANRRHSEGKMPLEAVAGLTADDSDRAAMLKMMYGLIADLRPLDKSMILMWLDERSYDEIAEVTGLTRNTVATRLRRIKQNLARRGNQDL